MQLQSQRSAGLRQKQTRAAGPKCVRVKNVHIVAQSASTAYAGFVNTAAQPSTYTDQRQQSISTAGGRAINLANLRKAINQDRTVKFHVRYKCDFGQEVFLVGNVPELGNWEVTKGVRLTWSEGHLWQGAINIATGGRLQYKYVVRNCDGSVARWQEGPNVALELPGANLKACAMEVEDSWNQARQVKRIMAAGTPVKFNMHKQCEFGQKLVVVGSCTQLGAWDVTKGLELKWTDGDVWEVSAELPSGEGIQYKYVVVNEDGSAAEWQEGNNLSMNVPQVQAKKGKRRGVLVLDSWKPAAGRARVGLRARGAPPAPPPQTAWMDNPYASVPVGHVSVHTDAPRFGSSNGSSSSRSSGLGGASSMTDRLWQVEHMVGSSSSTASSSSSSQTHDPLAVHHMWTDKPRFGSSRDDADMEALTPGQYSPSSSSGFDQVPAVSLTGSGSAEELSRWQTLNSVIQALQHSSELSHWVNDPTDPRMLAADRRLAALTASLGASSGLASVPVA